MKHFPFLHSWTKWGKLHVNDVGCVIQTRRCKTCGKIQERRTSCRIGFNGVVAEVNEEHCSED